MLPLDLSNRYNAMYGLQEMAAALAFMCEKGESANKALTTMRIANPGAKIPTPQWLLAYWAAYRTTPWKNHTSACWPRRSGPW